MLSWWPAAVPASPRFPRLSYLGYSAGTPGTPRRPRQDTETADLSDQWARYAPNHLAIENRPGEIKAFLVFDK